MSRAPLGGGRFVAAREGESLEEARIHEKEDWQHQNGKKKQPHNWKGEKGDKSSIVRGGRKRK